jgi:LuxR family quorum-sensing system transcriptional regulator ExpR
MIVAESERAHIMSKFYSNENINNKIKSLLVDNILDKDDDKFGYFIISKRDLVDISIINNHPEWFDLYVENNHQMVDPVVMKALSRVESFDWDDEIIRTSRLALPKVMIHAKKHDINSGHTFIIHDCRNNLVLLSIFSSDLEITGEKRSLNHERKLSLFVKIHQKLLSMYEFFEKDNKSDKVDISERENAILYWAAMGKTYKEIATRLGITESTIKFHMAKIVHKLEAANAKHAIRLASDSKLIHLPAGK